MLDTHGTYTRRRPVDDDDGTDAWITAGDALTQALDSLGLELPRPKPHRRFFRGLAWGVTLTLLAGGLWVSVGFMISALAALDPTRLPQ